MTQPKTDLAYLRSYPFARYHKIRMKKPIGNRNISNRLIFFIRQISFRLMPGLLQLEVRCTLQLFHKAYHLPTLPMRA